MNKDQYIRLSNDLITNNSSYVEFDRDPTNSIQGKLHSRVKCLHDSKHIDTISQNKNNLP